jgi:hypothetical protein
MREIRTYGLMRGCWLARHRRRSRGLLNPSSRPPSPLTFKELVAITKDKSVYEFLQQEIVDGYHDNSEFKWPGPQTVR